MVGDIRRSPLYHSTISRSKTDCPISAQGVVRVSASTTQRGVVDGEPVKHPWSAELVDPQAASHHFEPAIDLDNVEQSERSVVGGM